MLHRLSIVLRTALMVGLLLVVTLGSAALWIYRTEESIVATMLTQLQGNTLTAIDSQQQAESIALQQSITAQTQLLAGISNIYVYDLNPEGLEPVLLSFMKGSDIQAVVITENPTTPAPFFAAWRDQEGTLQSGKQLPDSWQGGNSQRTTSPILRNEETLGTLESYFNNTAMVARLDQLRQERLNGVATFEQQLQAELKATTRQQIWGGVGVTLLLMAALALLLRQMISLPLQRLLRELEGIGADLQQRLRVIGEDEVARIATGVNGFIAHLQQLVQSVRQDSESIASGTKQLNQQVEQMQQTFTTGQQAVARVEASVEQMSLQGRELDRSVAEVSRTSHAANELTHSGRQRLAEAVTDMATTEGYIAELATTMSRVLDSSQQINQILKAINDLADQTNLLALNAAIEAARAGEAGRGFSVVASEVRILAERTQSSTADIRTIITTLQQETTHLSANLKQAVAGVATSVGAVRDSDQLFQELRQAMEAIEAARHQIDQAVASQKQQAAEVAAAVMVLKEGLHQSSREMNAVSTALSDYNQFTDALTQQVSRFRA